MATVKRKCVVCGCEYKYCYGCRGDKDKPTWMNVFHDENCRKIYYTCTNFEVGHYGTKEEAKKQLEELDLSKKENFTPMIANWVDDILGTPKSIKKKSAKEVDE